MESSLKSTRVSYTVRSFIPYLRCLIHTPNTCFTESFQFKRSWYWWARCLELKIYICDVSRPRRWTRKRGRARAQRQRPAAPHSSETKYHAWGGRGVATVTARGASSHAPGAERGIFRRPEAGPTLLPGDWWSGSSAAVIGGITAISSNGNEPEAGPEAEGAWRGGSSKWVEKVGCAVASSAGEVWGKGRIEG